MSNQSVQTVTTSADKAKLGVAVVALFACLIGFYFLAGQSIIIRVAVLTGGLLLAVGAAWTSALGQDFIGFARESARETKKVVWPSRREAMQITGVVFGFVFIMALFLLGTDKLLEVVLYDLILGWR